ncbi:MAG: N-acetyltransferase family protein [Dehalococcoidia bacterium]
MAQITISPATPDDVPTILDLIRGLAEYEHEPESATATAGQLHEALFAARPAAECAIARLDDEVAGFALWFQNFSTWTGRPGLWLEDLFVWPHLRRQGVGRALLQHLAAICVERNYGRFEWSVLDWNEPSINFYRSLGAVPMDEWTNFRLIGDALRMLGAESPRPQGQG